MKKKITYGFSFEQLKDLLAICTPMFTPEMGQRMSTMRMHLKLDQKQLGDLLGVSRSVISHIERGDKTRHVFSASKLIDVFGIKASSYIFFKMFEDSYLENTKNIHTEYWKTKHKAKGNRIPWYERDTAPVLEMKKNTLKAEIEELKTEKENLGKNRGRLD